MIPRKFFGKLDKLAALKGDNKKDDDKEIIVVYVKDDKKKGNKNKHNNNDRWEVSEEEYVSHRPIKHRPVKYESYEDSSEYEYVRPIKVKKTKTQTKPIKVVKPVYVTASSYETSHESHSSSNNNNKGKWDLSWITDKLANKFNKGGKHEESEEITYVIKKSGNKKGGHKGGNKWEVKDSYEEESYEHGSKPNKGGNKWDSYEESYEHGSKPNKGGDKWSKYD